MSDLLRMGVFLREVFPKNVFFKDWRRPMLVYSLFDRKLKEYGQLAQQRNDEAVMRALTDGVRGSNSMVERHPSDFDVMQVAEFDVETGVVTACVPPRFVANLGEMLRKEPGPDA